MDRHETQTETEPTREQWLALHHAFRRYCESRPWERLANEDVLVVNDPPGHFKGYCVALGDGGVAYGLGVYLGDRGLLNCNCSRLRGSDRPDAGIAYLATALGRAKKPADLINSEQLR